MYGTILEKENLLKFKLWPRILLPLRLETRCCWKKTRTRQFNYGQLSWLLAQLIISISASIGLIACPGQREKKKRTFRRLRGGFFPREPISSSLPDIASKLYGVFGCSHPLIFFRVKLAAASRVSCLDLVLSLTD